MPDFTLKVSQSILSVCFNVRFEIQMKQISESC